MVACVVIDRQHLPRSYRRAPRGPRQSSKPRSSRAWSFPSFFCVSKLSTLNRGSQSARERRFRPRRKVGCPRTMLARHVVLLTPSKSSHPNPLLSRQHFALISPLTATLMDLPASVANKRLTARLSPLDATLIKNRGGGVPVMVNQISDKEICRACPEHLGEEHRDEGSASSSHSMERVCPRYFSGYWATPRVGLGSTDASGLCAGPKRCRTRRESSACRR
jgi:hypothetical protein